MDNSVLVIKSDSAVAGYYNVTFSIDEETALHPLDVGDVTLLAVTLKRMAEEVEGYASMGYKRFKHIAR